MNESDTKPNFLINRAERERSNAKTRTKAQKRVSGSLQKNNKKCMNHTLYSV